MWEGDFYQPTTRLRWGFKSKKQLPLFMVWREIFGPDGEVEFAYVIFSSRDWIGA